MTTLILIFVLQNPTIKSFISSFIICASVSVMILYYENRKDKNVSKPKPVKMSKNNVFKNKNNRNKQQSKQS